MYIVYMFSGLFLIMCLHPKLELYRNDATMDVADLEKFDTCDYIHSVKHMHLDDLIIMQLNIRGLYTKTSILTDLLSSCVDGRSPDIVLLYLVRHGLLRLPHQYPSLDMILFIVVDPTNEVVVWEY